MNRGEYLAIGGPVIPLLIGEIRGMRSLRGFPSVTLAFKPMTLAAPLLKNYPALRDGCRRRWDRILEFLSVIRARRELHTVSHADRRRQTQRHSHSRGNGPD